MCLNISARVRGKVCSEASSSMFSKNRFIQDSMGEQERKLLTDSGSFKSFILEKLFSK
jgi:hypothetical protein